MPLISHPIGVRSTVRALVKVLRIEGLCEAAWFAGNRQFVTMADHHHDDRLAIWYAAPRGAQEALLQAAPGRFFRPPYVGHRGWIGVYLDVPDVDWEQVTAIVDRPIARSHQGTLSRSWIA